MQRIFVPCTDRILVVSSDTWAVTDTLLSDNAIAQAFVDFTSGKMYSVGANAPWTTNDFFVDVYDLNNSYARTTHLGGVVDLYGGTGSWAWVPGTNQIVGAVGPKLIAFNTQTNTWSNNAITFPLDPATSDIPDVFKIWADPGSNNVWCYGGHSPTAPIQNKLYLVNTSNWTIINTVNIGVLANPWDAETTSIGTITFAPDARLAYVNYIGYAAEGAPRGPNYLLNTLPSDNILAIYNADTGAYISHTLLPVNSPVAAKSEIDPVTQTMYSVSSYYSDPPFTYNLTTSTLVGPIPDYNTNWPNSPALAIKPLDSSEMLVLGGQPPADYGNGNTFTTVNRSTLAISLKGSFSFNDFMAVGDLIIEPSTSTGVLLQGTVAGSSTLAGAFPPPINTLGFSVGVSGSSIPDFSRPILPPLLSSDAPVMGIYQTDLYFRTALLAGLRDIRNQPQLLDYCFASLLWDPLTDHEIRQSQIATAKTWFLDHQIPIVAYPKLDQMQFPCITVATQESAESGNTLADIHDITSFDGDSISNIVIGPFSVKSYDVTTGVITLPDSLTPLFVSSRMEIVDRTGRIHPIVSSGGGYTINIAPGSLGDFTKAIVQVSSPNSSTNLESAFFSESFSVGCYTQGDPVFTLYLTSIVTFILLKYRQAYLEARGYERTALKVGPLMPLDNLIEGKENVFGRHITVMGHVQHVWPKYTWPVIGAVGVGLVIDTADATPAPLNPLTSLWRGVNDPSVVP